MKFDFSDLKGKVAVITGGAGVIGYAICEAMASVGIKTAIIDINKEAAENTAYQLAAKFNIDCIGVEANVLDKQSLIAAKRVINEKFGAIDILLTEPVAIRPKLLHRSNSLPILTILKNRFLVSKWMVLIRFLHSTLMALCFLVWCLPQICCKKGKG
jgi:hypothetical protein